jgi:hypothetical protein
MEKGGWKMGGLWDAGGFNWLRGFGLGREGAGENVLTGLERVW